MKRVAAVSNRFATERPGGRLLRFFSRNWGASHMNQFANLNQQYIGGKWRDGASKKTLTDKNPYNGKSIADFKLASLSDLDEAYRSAAAAQKIWAEVNPFEKRTILEKAITWIEQNEADITDIIIDELGGTHLKAFIEIMLVKSFLKEASTYPLRMTGEILPSTVDGKENRMYRIPAGVVGVISPFNFPFNLSMRSVAPALACGNGVVLKPHDDTPIMGGTLIAKIFEETGIPKGLLNVIVADIGEIGDAFVEHPIPRIISFTGSEGVGRHIGGVAGRALKKAILELGGNSAFIVLEDADLQTAINAAVFSRFAHQGQVCMCSNRILVQRSVYSKFLDKFVNQVSKLKTGDPRDPQTDLGPLINQRQAETFSKQVQKGIDEGARTVLRGKVEGNVASPTIFADVKPDMWIAQNELFGPAVCVIPFDTPQDAIRIANDSPYGLSGAIHTQDVEYGAELAKQIESGMVHVNDGTINDDPLIAFGGEKASGVGRLNGKWALEEFTTLKWISVQHKRRHYPFEVVVPKAS
jgi:aldehyde dehydrogenase (NAD+)